MRTEPACSSLRLTRWSLASALLLALSGCGAMQSTPSGSLREEIGEVPPELRKEYESFAVNCSKCHGLERALAAPVTDTRHWDIYVAKMMRTAGSAIHPDEAAPILRFLYWYTERKKSPGGEMAESIDEATPPAPSDSAAPAAREEQSVPATAPAPSVTSESEGESKP